jgi:hypothetical protein
MSVVENFSSGLGLTLVTAILGSVWTAFRSSEFYSRARNERYGAALEALEAGVELTYRTYVRSIKESREDGKLTQEEMRLARRRAREAAIEFGRTRGIDILKELGANYIDLIIAKQVKNLKTT